LTEKELILGCLREDRAIQKEFFRKYAGKMLGVSRRYARHELEAEDILQDAFVKVFNNLSKFQHKGSLEGWIRRIVVNTALKNFQRKSYTNERIGLNPMDDRPIDPTAITDLGEQDILDLIKDLPDGYRVVFNMYVIEGYSHREIAEKLEIGESTSRSQLVKARKMLMNRITKLQSILL